MNTIPAITASVFRLGWGQLRITMPAISVDGGDAQDTAPRPSGTREGVHEARHAGDHQPDPEDHDQDRQRLEGFLDQDQSGDRADDADHRQAVRGSRRGPRTAAVIARMPSISRKIPKMTVNTFSVSSGSATRNTPTREGEDAEHQQRRGDRFQLSDLVPRSHRSYLFVLIGRDSSRARRRRRLEGAPRRGRSCAS